MSIFDIINHLLISAIGFLIWNYDIALEFNAPTFNYYVFLGIVVFLKYCFTNTYENKK